MSPSRKRRIAVLLVSAAVGAAAAAGAQTLERRPAPAQKPRAGITAPGKPATVGKQSAVGERELVLPRGTSLQVEITRAYPMKEEAIEGQLMHPLYAQGKLAVPEGTQVVGKVVALEADEQVRRRGRLVGDFTPFHRARVQFDEIMVRGGPLPIFAAVASAGAPIVQLTAPGAAPRKSLISREWTQAKTQARGRVEWFTAPGLGERALQVLYHQLPYHPQRIEAQTAWSFELAAPLTLPGPPPAAEEKRPPSTPRPGQSEIWDVNALLTRRLSSGRARAGDAVQALVVEPVYDKEKKLVVPEGSMLVGKVTAAKAARSFGRNGKLRFSFQEVRFPEGFGKPVEGTVAHAAAEQTENLQMDAEGTITPRSRSRVVAPLVLTMLAGRALDEDGNMTADTGVASNGFGLVGRVVGMAAGNRSLAAGIGFYAAALSVYENFLHRGQNVIFPKDTRIEIETTPLRAPVLRAASR